MRASILSLPSSGSRLFHPMGRGMAGVERDSVVWLNAKRARNADELFFEVPKVASGRVAARSLGKCLDALLLC